MLTSRTDAAALAPRVGPAMLAIVPGSRLLPQNVLCGPAMVLRVG